MSKIVGNVVGVPNPQPDCLQTDPTKADYIKNTSIFANALKGSKSGTSVCVDDVASAEHDLVVTVTDPTGSGYNLTGLPVKCGATLYGEAVQTAYATADCIVEGLTSIAPNMALWTEYGNIKSGDMLGALYFDTNANLDNFLANLDYPDSGTFAGIHILVKNSTYTEMLCAVDLGKVTEGIVPKGEYAFAVISHSSGRMEVIVLYSTAIFNVSAAISGCRADKIGWQKPSVSWSMIVQEVYLDFAPLNGRIVKTLPHVIIDVNYNRDINLVIGNIEKKLSYVVDLTGTSEG